MQTPFAPRQFVTCVTDEQKEHYVTNWIRSVITETGKLKYEVIFASRYRFQIFDK